MKIGILNDWWKPNFVGGAERSAYEMCISIQSEIASSEIHIFTLSNSSETEITSEEGFLIHRIGSNTFRKKYLSKKIIKYLEKMRIFFDFSTARKIAYAVHQENIEFLIIHNLDRFGPRLIEELSKYPTIKILRIFHDLGDACIRRTRYRRGICDKTCFQCMPKTYHYRKASKGYVMGIGVSQFVVAKLVSLGFSPRGFDSGYPIPKKNQIILKKSIKQNSRSLTLGYVGRIVPEKGIETLLSALEILRHDYETNFSLIIVGQGDSRYIKKLKRVSYTKKLDVTFAGFSERPYEFLRSATNIIVVPSLWEEPFGRVPFESSLNGMISVVANCGGLAESNRIISQGLMFFETGNSKDLADKLLVAMQIPKQITIVKQYPVTLAQQVIKYLKENIR